MSDLDLWEQDGAYFGWLMPTAPWWKRLPVIRHIRAAYHTINVARHNAAYARLGAIPTGYDEWVIWGIAAGKERRKGSEA